MKKLGLWTLAGLIILSHSSLAFSQDREMTPTEIKDRIAPAGQVYIAKETAPPSTPTSEAKGSQRGEQVFQKYCTACHTTGAAGAPKIGDVQAWQPRAAAGLDTLVEHATKGYKLMPPKGTCAECSPEDIKAAVEFILSKSIKKTGASP